MQEQGDNISIIFQDEVKGMTSETLEHICESFYTTNRGSNIGLGLHAAYNRVHHSLKGSIECSGELNKATSFVLKSNRYQQQQSFRFESGDAFLQTSLYMSFDF